MVIGRKNLFTRTGNASERETAPIAVVVNSNASVGAEVNAFPMATCNMI